MHFSKHDCPEGFANESNISGTPTPDPESVLTPSTVAPIIIPPFRGPNDFGTETPISSPELFDFGQEVQKPKSMLPVIIGGTLFTAFMALGLIGLVKSGEQVRGKW